MVETAERANTTGAGRERWMPFVSAVRPGGHRDRRVEDYVSRPGLRSLTLPARRRRKASNAFVPLEETYLEARDDVPEVIRDGIVRQLT